MLPSYLHKFTVVKYEAHTKSNDIDSQGNAMADHAAKAAAKIGNSVHVKLCPTIPDLVSPVDVALLQKAADEEENRLRLSHGFDFVICK